MKSKLISTLIVAAAALTSVGASAQPFNPFLWDQMASPTTRTRAEVKAELTQTRQVAGTDSSGSTFYGVTGQQNLAAPTPAKAGNAQASAGMVKTSQQ